MAIATDKKILAQYNDVIKHLNKKWHILDDDSMPLLKDILLWLDNPDKKLKVIHIAGTNGKSSSVAMLTAILKSNGYRCGHFSSPFILSEREQIGINDELILPQNFLKYYNQIIAVLKTHQITTDRLTQFEYFMLVALLYFVDQQVDFVLLEAGLGGLKDATNAITAPLIAVFTKISLDYQGIIGKNLVEIAQDEAAIIKPDTIVVDYAGQEADVRRVLKERAVIVAANLFNRAPDKIVIQKATPSGSDLIINGETGYFLSTSGAFQVQNLSVVLQVKAVLETLGYQFNVEKTKAGLANIQVLGRMDYHQDVNILFDAAHNVDGINGLVTALNAWHLKIKPTLVFGVLKDKDYHEMLDTIIPVVQRVITVTPNNATRALPAEELAAEILTNYPTIDVEIASDASAAISLAMRVRESSQALIVVTGSFYTLNAIQKEGRI